MAGALFHRGPDEEGFLQEANLSLASRRLSILGLSDGQQPITNEDGTIAVVLNGELFDYTAVRAELEGRGHQFATHCDTELLPHLWEEYQEGMLERLRGQFAFALWDEGRRRLLLARDRFGICPLYWTRQGGWLLFASEVKALLASGMVKARADLRGINHVFTFFAVPGPVTCFAGVRALLPGHYLQVDLDAVAGPEHGAAAIRDRIFWEPTFPEACNGIAGGNARELVDKFEGLMLQAVERRLQADVPVVAYLSGGVDSSLVVALAGRVLGKPIPTFSIRVEDPHLNESRYADFVARHLGAEPFVVSCGRAEVLNSYPRLIRAAEAPVIDTACAALLLLAQEVHARGYKVALTGEGADEWLAGYPWFKVHKLCSLLDMVPGLPVSPLARRLLLRLSGAPPDAWRLALRNEEAAGGPNAWLYIYGLMSLSKLRFFSRQFWQAIGDESPFKELELNLERLRQWHPLNRSIYFGGRIMLPGLLLNAKGDRVAMHSSVETRYPFLDEEVFAFLAGLGPQWKLRGFQDKYLLRLLAERWLPCRIAWRRKAMFRAPMDSFYSEPPPAFVDQLLSDESLRRTGYFDQDAVRHWRCAFHQLRADSYQRISLEMGLVGVVATQLWHHTFIDPSLADLPGFTPSAEPALAS
jgi:asparagine synthase (glutamine-hydrolysing)